MNSCNHGKDAACCRRHPKARACSDPAVRGPPPRAYHSSRPLPGGVLVQNCVYGLVRCQQLYRTLWLPAAPRLNISVQTRAAGPRYDWRHHGLVWISKQDCRPWVRATPANLHRAGSSLVNFVWGSCEAADSKASICRATQRLPVALRERHNFLPCFVLPEQMTLFRSAAQNIRAQGWVVKPSHGSSGEGIRIVQSVAAVHSAAGARRGPGSASPEPSSAFQASARSATKFAWQ